MRGNSSLQDKHEDQDALGMLNDKQNQFYDSINKFKWNEKSFS
jgi:hypothetical protein